MTIRVVLADVNGVARIRSALVSGHDIDVLGEHVDDLPLPFVAPLTADDDGAATLSGHDAS